jgi:hypothetical protein
MSHHLSKEAYKTCLQHNQREREKEDVASLNQQAPSSIPVMSSDFVSLLGNVVCLCQKLIPVQGRDVNQSILISICTYTRISELYQIKTFAQTIPKSNTINL